MSDSDDGANLPNRKNKNLKSARKQNKKNSLGEKEEDESKGFDKANGDGGDDYKKAKLRNPKAFALQSYVAAERQFRR
jgi:hypothetical protein